MLQVSPSVALTESARHSCIDLRMNEALNDLHEFSSSASSDIYLATEIYLASNPFSIYTGSSNVPTFDIYSENVPPCCEELPAYNLLSMQFLRMMVEQFTVTVDGADFCFQCCINLLLSGFCAVVWSAAEENQGWLLPSSARWISGSLVSVPINCLTTGSCVIFIACLLNDAYPMRH